ncbi:unnamed protein product, partial [marine sediment metagenome]
IEGVGTKVLLAQLADKYDTIGVDGVAMAVNDVIRSGATPLALVDNFHAHVSDPDLVKEWLKGIVQDATGVKVTLDAIDPNGNFISIGTATSDMSGFYSYQWTPEHEGKYTIIATFAGSKSYYSSYAETAVGVDPAPSPAQPIEPEPAEPTGAFALTTTELAIIVAVIAAVVGIVAFWVLRKRK